MAVDQNVSSSAPKTPAEAAIENELPAYRAISAQAVVSLLFGVLAVLSIANSFFLLCAVVAVVLGVLADRKIQRHSEMLTGRGFARVGTALGLVFGLGTFTVLTVQDFIRSSSATRFAKQYVDVLKSGSVEQAYWYKLAPAQQKGQTPASAYEDFKKQAKDARMAEMQLGSTTMIHARLASTQGQDLRFVRIESHGTDGMDSYAAALLELEGPTSKNFPDKVQYALLVIKGPTENGRIAWRVDDVKVPYQPSSFVPPSKPVDDGHGHAGGHGH